jgi:3-methylcrotonyl-CoA carboxylase beta subunit
MRYIECMRDLMPEIREQEAIIRQGGEPDAHERQRSKGRLTARKRVALLLDPGTQLFELSIFAAFGMYEEWGGAPAAGVVTGIGNVCGRRFMIIANDATVKAGAFFPMTCKKVLRAQIIALENHIPTIYLVDSAGVFLPLQEDSFPDQDDFGRVYYHNALMSARGIPQITAIMGNCVAGGAYLPVMCDYLLMTEGSSLSLAGPALVKAAIGQEATSEELGGAKMHASVSGTIDYWETDDTSCIQRIRQLVEKFGAHPKGPFTPKAPVPPKKTFALADDTRDIITGITDGSEFVEYKADYGQTLVCGHARVGGYSVGFVANQRQHVRPPGKPVEFGTVIYADAANKAARFIMDCNQSLIPLVFLHDVSGFMVGKDAEMSGIIKSGAKMVSAVSNSVVPKITVIMGGSYGAGNFAMCGKAYDPRFIFAWPTARYGVMAGAHAAQTLADSRIRKLEREGKKLSAAEKEHLIAQVKEMYDAQLDVRYAASRLWVDKIIAPEETRDSIALAVELANLNPDVPKFNVGILQV